MKKLNGKEMVALLKSNREAQVELYNGVLASVKGRCMKHGYLQVISEEDMYDVVHQAYFNIINALHTYDVSRPFDNWKNAIIHNALCSAVNRGVKSQELVKSYDEGYSTSDEGLDVDTPSSYEMDAYMYRNGVDYEDTRADKEVDYNDFLDKLRSVLKGQAFNVICDFMDGYSYEEIAKREGISVTNVGAIKSRAKKKLEAYHLVS